MNQDEAEFPDPLVPAHVDLSGLAFMPVDIIRLLDSDLFAISTGDEFKAAFTLWGRSWFQAPAGSLPVDDRVLAHLAGYRSGDWQGVREMALRGWIKCNDGRLYHHVVAEKVLSAWEKRGKWIEREDTKNERQQRWREKLRILSSRLRSIGITVPERLKARELEALCRQHGVDANVDGDASTVDPEETAYKGKGKGKYKDSNSTPNGVAAAKRGSRLPDDFTIPPAWIGWAVDDGWDRAAAEREGANFIDYWHAATGRAATKLDWLATWRKWMRKERDSRKPRERNRQPNGKEYLGC